MRRLLRAGAMLLTFASSVMAGERYIEVSNPPEARGAARQAAPLRTISMRSMSRHASPRPGRFHPRQSAAALPKLASKHGQGVDRPRLTQPDVADIPWQITPEGHILRVGTGEARAQIDQ